MIRPLDDPFLFSVEVTYWLPVCVHVQVEATSVEGACSEALQTDDWWDKVEKAYDGSSACFVSGVWSGQPTYNGRDLTIPHRFRSAYGEALELVRRIAAGERIPHDLLTECRRIIALPA